MRLFWDLVVGLISIVCVVMFIMFLISEGILPEL